MPRYPLMSPSAPDDFQTPPRALEPLMAHIDPAWVVWECAAGKGNLVHALRGAGRAVIGTDLAGFDGEPPRDFLTWAPVAFDCVITNPPYQRALKYKFVKRCYELGRPWALLMPLTALEGRRRQALYRGRNLQVIFFDERIDFETPGKNKDGKKGGAWYPTAWFTHGLNLPEQMTFYEFRRPAPEPAQVPLPGLALVTEESR